MDRNELKLKLIPFEKNCEKKGRALSEICIEDAYPGDSTTSYIIKVKATWVDNMDCSEALDFLFDTLWESVDIETRKFIFSIYVLDSSNELHCWADN